MPLKPGMILASLMFSMTPDLRVVVVIVADQHDSALSPASAILRDLVRIDCDPVPLLDLIVKNDCPCQLICTGSAFLFWA